MDGLGIGNPSDEVFAESTPIQLAVSAILAQQNGIQKQISARITENKKALHRRIYGYQLATAYRALSDRHSTFNPAIRQTGS